jgi:hypothetical protein
VVMSGEDAPRPYPEDLIVLEIKTNKQTICTPGQSANKQTAKEIVFYLFVYRLLIGVANLAIGDRFPDVIGRTFVGGTHFKQ